MKKFGWSILSVLLLVGATEVVSTSAFADIVTVTYVGTASGSDPLEIFGENAGVSLSNRAYTAIFVFDTSGATSSTGFFSINGGSLGASITINNHTQNFLGTSVGILEIINSDNPFNARFEAAAFAFDDPTHGMQLAVSSILTTGIPFPKSISDPFTYTPQNGDIVGGAFLFGSERLDLTASSVSLSVSAVPEPSTWAMMILGFAGVGFMAHRRSRKDQGLALAA
jgi:hypothetical protein